MNLNFHIKKSCQKWVKQNWIEVENNPYRVWIATAVLTVLFLELLSRKSLWSLLQFIFVTPHLFLVNLMIVLVTYSPMFLVKRWGFARGIAAIWWSVIGIVNFVLLFFRTTPFNWHDLDLLDTAVRVMDHYLSAFGYVLIAVFLLLCLGFLVWMYRRAPKREKTPDYRKGLRYVITAAALCIYIWSVGRWSDILPRNYSNIAQAYQTYGLAYCFTNSMISTGISKPENYDVQKVDNIIQEEIVPEKEAAGADASRPNVIFLQLESFFDLEDLNTVSLSRDPIPNFRHIFEEFSSGFLSVPSVGAGTANTEFEILTGMNLDFFGCGEYPYQTVLREQTCESLAYCYGKLGYTPHAIHNNSASFYNRNTVFSRLGFHSFTSLEYMYDLSYTPEGWTKDKVLTQNILQAMKSTENRDFVYAISVQGHGAYPTEPVLRYPSVRASLRGEELREDEELKYQMTYYASQLYEMDAFIGALTQALQEYQEPCVLVLYGDHLPELGIQEEDLNQGTLFTTKYAIWSNFSMEKQDRDLESYQLGAYVMQQLGIQEGILFRYHQRYLQEKNMNEAAYLDSMAIIEYDMLYGEQEVFEGEEPYRPVALKMGILPITLERVEYQDGTLVLYGNNFNEFSVIIINGKQYTPTGVSRDRLWLEELVLEEDAHVCAAQRDDYGKTLLSMTKNFKVQGLNSQEPGKSN